MPNKPLIPDPADEPTITIELAAKALGISRNGAYAAAARGDLPVIRIGARRVVVPTAALRRMLQLDEPIRATSAPAA